MINISKQKDWYDDKAKQSKAKQSKAKQSKAKQKNMLCKCGCGKVKGKRSGFSERCKRRMYRAKYPINAAYQNLKSNAKRRKINFDLTKEFFKKLVESTGYIEGKGRAADSLTIDRIKNWLGYSDGNIQVMLKADNINKYHQLDVKEMQEHLIFISEKKTAEYPF